MLWRVRGASLRGHQRVWHLWKDQRCLLLRRQVSHNTRKAIMEIDKIYNIDCEKGMALLPEGYNYCIVTDPPFNIGYHYNKYRDKMEETEYYKWLAKIIGGRPCCIIHYPEALYKLAFYIGDFPQRVVSWVYNSNTPRQHRDAAYFGVKPNFNLVRQPYKNPTDRRIMERMAKGFVGSKCYDWVEINQVKNVSKKANKNGITHPCQMPEEVMRRLVGIIPEDFVIVDPFIGSGTTAIAAIKQKRHFIGMELDKEYYDIACKRVKDELINPTLF